MTTETLCRADLIRAVRRHAMALYEQGWDEVEECYTDDDLDAFIGEAATAKAAIKTVAATLGLPAVGLTGYIVTNADVDGTSRRAYKSLRYAAERFEDMTGQPLPADAADRLGLGQSVTIVGTFGNVVTIRQA